MPIVSYCLVAGSLLLGLLFAVDSVLPPREPLKLGSDFHGLAQAVHVPQATTDSPILRQTSAPEPDMSSELVRAAQPPEQNTAQPALAKVLASSKVMPASTSAAKPESTRKGQKFRKRVVQQRPWRDENRRAYAWSWQNENRPWYRGERRFGRF
jgi:hypothetical protein